METTWSVEGLGILLERMHRKSNGKEQEDEMAIVVILLVSCKLQPTPSTPTKIPKPHHPNPRVPKT